MSTHVETAVPSGAPLASATPIDGRSNHALITAARVAIKQGDKRKARLLLQQAIRQDVEDHTAWAWLATVTSSPETGLAYARRAERLMPGDALVQKVNAWAERRWQAFQEPSDSESSAAMGRGIAIEQVLRSRRVWVGIAIGLTILLSLASVLAWKTVDRNADILASNESDSSLPLVSEVRVQESLAAVVASPEATKVQPTATPAPPRIQAKIIASGVVQGQDTGPRATWTATPSPTNTPSPTPTYMPTYVSSNNSEPVARPFGVAANEHWIDVDLSSQTLSAYEGNERVFSTNISSGTWQHPTVTGQFRVWVRYRSQTMDGRRLGYDYYLENVPYVMYFYEDYALHGTYWHNNFGTPMSHGCVNMRTADAEWIFNWSSLGTLVNVHQ